MDYIPTYNFDLLPVLLSIVFLAVVVLWVAIKNHHNFLLMFILIPLTLGSGWTIYTTVDSLLGYPVFDEISEDSLYVTHVEDPLGDYIYVWLIKPGELRPKSVMIENSEENKKALEDAKEGQEGGVPQQLRTEGGEVDRTGQTNGGALESYDFQNNGFEAIKDEQRNNESDKPRPMPGKVGGNVGYTPSRPNQLSITSDNNSRRLRETGTFRVLDQSFHGGK
ncbi:hypothetical protein N9R43_00720 [bacterium]|nr:hypothetical protein [bacterium]